MMYISMKELNNINVNKNNIKNVNTATNNNTDGVVIHIIDTNKYNKDLIKYLK